MKEQEQRFGVMTCKKLYSDLPFSHRQPKHDGHCAQVHGHNFGFEFTFSCSELDENGFVIDFGKLKFLKEFLYKHFDHTFVVPEYDCEMSLWQETHKKGLINLVVVPDASAEGLAKWLLEEATKIVEENSNGRVWVSAVTVQEDEKNSATYSR